MRVVTIDKIKTNEIISTILSGGVIVLPFDTVYGLLADPFNDKAMAKIYAIKGRDFNKPVALIFSSPKMLKKFIDIKAETEKFIAKKVPGAYTFIFPWSEKEKMKFAKQYHTLVKVGARIPNYNFVLNLINKLGQPIAATSANLSNKPNCWQISDFLKQIGKQKQKPDLIIDAGTLKKNPPSEVIDVSDLKQISILRKR